MSIFYVSSEKGSREGGRTPTLIGDMSLKKSIFNFYALPLPNAYSTRPHTVYYTCKGGGGEEQNSK